MPCGDLLISAEEVIDVYHSGDQDFDVVGAEQVVESLSEVEAGFGGTDHTKVVFAVFVNQVSGE